MTAELEARNRTMFRLYSSGKTLQDLADQFGVSRQRVAQIVSRHAQLAVSDDESRTLMRSQLEFLQSEMLAIVAKGPHPAVNVKGEIIYDENGDQVPNYVDVINAAELVRKTSESIRKLDALDLPRRKQMVEDEAMKQAMAYLAALPQAEVIHDQEDPIV